ncbi:calcium-dependent protein kinase 4-like [Musa acuminata AAA Group]|uniref:calcium-dependent protein kinase 4-like n=1 Tax=Musa acuminata AAA Group TaxID=214697 RepID=UPI0031D0284B
MQKSEALLDLSGNLPIMNFMASKGIMMVEFYGELSFLKLLLASSQVILGFRLMEWLLTSLWILQFYIARNKFCNEQTKKYGYQSKFQKSNNFGNKVLAEHLSEDEIADLKEMFKMIDADNSGQITFEELKVGLER